MMIKTIIKKRIKIILTIILSLVIVVWGKEIAGFFRRGYKNLGYLFKSTPTPTLKVFTNPTLQFKEVVFQPSLVTISNSPTIIPTSTPKPTKVIKKTPTPTSRPTPNQQNLPSADSLSKSKLGIFMIGHLTNGAKKIIEGNPPVIKVIEPLSDPSFFEAIRAYKQRVPQGIVIVRFYNGTQGLYYSLSSNPVSSAEDFFNRVVKPGIEALGDKRQLFDYMQNPNEFETTPEWWGEAKIKWNGAFWKKLTELTLNYYGVKTCIGGIPVGNIEASELGYILEDLKAIKNMGGAFCYHGYTFSYSQNLNQEINLSLRYRQFYNFFSSSAPELLNMPLILSEGGVAEGGDPSGGYLKSGRVDDYKNWLVWFDNELKKDSYVKGVTLFQIGNDSDWNYFNLEPISSWLSEYIRL